VQSSTTSHGPQASSSLRAEFASSLSAYASHWNIAEDGKFVLLAEEEEEEEDVVVVVVVAEEEEEEDVVAVAVVVGRGGEGE